MTLCIAANVKHLSGDAIVCCFDFRIETQTSGSNTGYKFRKISGDWAAMLAGDTPKADRLLDLFIQEFDGKDIKQRDAVNEIRKVVANYRRELVEEYVQNVLSMSYQDLLNSKGSLPDTLFEQVFQEMVKITHGCELILFNLKYKCPFLFMLDSEGHADQYRNFVAIGTGAPNAEAWLHFREQQSFDSVDKTLTSVYEAKKFSEHAPGVGKTTRLAIIRGDSVRILADTENADKVWQKYGPKELIPPSPSQTIFPEADFFEVEWKSMTA